MWLIRIALRRPVSVIVVIVALVVIVVAIIFMPRGVADLAQNFRRFGWRYFQENIKAHRV